MILASDTRDQFADLFSLYEWVMIVTAAIVFAVVIVAAVVWRRRPDRTPSRRTEANLVELGYVLVLAGVIVTLVYATFTTERHVDAVAANTREQIQITAFQWGWRFRYPRASVTVLGDDNRPPTLHVPVGRPIVFSLRSQDVVHSFWVPAIRFKRDAWPEATTRFELTFDQPGVFAGRCAEFCGLHHADMGFTVVAEDAARFQRWLSAQKGAR